MTLLFARLDGPGAEGDRIAWAAVGDPDVCVRNGRIVVDEVVLGEGEWDDLDFLLRQNRTRPTPCLKCGARCVLFARRDHEGARFEIPPPVDDFVCDRCRR